jgi:glycosyltransferase involved in cell wall biosynthesis
LRDAIARHAFSRSSVEVIAVSPASAVQLRAFLNDQTPLPSGELTSGSRRAPVVHTVMNGIQQPKLLPRVQVRKDWGVAENDFVVGCLARIEVEKNPLFVCRLLSALPGRIHCVWIGDGRLRAQLEQSVREEGIEHRFRITGWRDNAAALLSGIDAFLLPSLYEGLPLALLEAMSTGLPCIVSDVEGTSDAIQHEANGLRCHPSHLQAWQAGVAALAESPALCRRLGDAARASWEHQFSLDSMTRATLRVYEAVVSRHLSAAVS